MHSNLPSYLRAAAATRPLGCANANLVTARVAVGGDLSPRRHVAAAQLADLVAAGVTHVVDCRLEHSDASFVASAAPQVAYLHVGVDDAGQRIPGAWFDTIVSWVSAAFEENPDAVVLLHCHMGINRGPSAALAVLVALGMDPFDALEQIRAARPIAAVGYAADVLAWHHDRLGAPEAVRARDLERLAAWQASHGIDIRSVIRRVRNAEADGLDWVA